MSSTISPHHLILFYLYTLARPQWLLVIITATSMTSLLYQNAITPLSTKGDSSYTLVNPSITNSLMSTETINSQENGKLLGVGRGKRGIESNCALLFFGLIKKISELVLPSIRKNVVEVNPFCDIFIHTYNFTKLPLNVRNNETNSDIEFKVDDVYQLTRNVLIDDMKSFFKKKRKYVSTVKKYGYLGWGACCLSSENMIKQWHSIESVWNLMDITRTSLHQYKHVGLFRSDVYYANPINISTSKAALPAFSSWYGVNDRLFYGYYDYAKIWATRRFDFVEPFIKYFLKTNHSWDNLIHLVERNGSFNERSISNYLRDGGRQGFHSETFLAKMLLNYSVPFETKPICVWRVRAEGVLLRSDC